MLFLLFATGIVAGVLAYQVWRVRQPLDIGEVLISPDHEAAHARYMGASWESAIRTDGPTTRQQIAAEDARIRAKRDAMVQAMEARRFPRRVS